MQRYDSDERSFQAQYLLAEAYRKSANWPKKLLEQNLLSTEEKRSQRSQQKVELLQRALSVFSALRKKINGRPDATELEPKLQSILRNSYFGEADILFELKDYEGALAAYRNTANRYRFEPESLEAMMRVSQCYEKLDKKRDAKQTVLQAQQILKSIPSEKDDRFPEVTSYSRKQWDQHLNWLVKNSP